MLGKTVAEIGEFGLIERIKRIVGKLPDERIIGIGDDASVIPRSEKPLVVTTDMLVEEIHFRLDWMTPEEIGYKSLAVNISDIAAMAGNPLYALVSIAMRANTPVALIEEFYRGALEACESYGVSIIGGDTNRERHLAVTITIIGEVEEGMARLRSHASPGEIILVTGELGASAAGLKILDNPTLAYAVDNPDALVTAHKRPIPRVDAALAASENGARAMEDISDGLASEVAHIAEASGVGARLNRQSIPVTPGVRQVAATLGEDPIDYALYGGEDYEIVFTAPPNRAADIIRAVEETGVAAHEIGEITEGRSLIIVEGGKESPLETGGYSHF